MVSNFFLQPLRNQDITIFGGGSQTRSFCYIDDLVGGLIKLMNTGDGVIGPINLGNPSEFSILELAQLVIELTGSQSRITRKPLPEDDPKQRQPDISKANQILGWKPAIPLRQGLESTIEYFERFLKERGDSLR